MMKRSINIILIISFLIVMFCPITNVKAKTLQTYKNELVEMQKRQNENEKVSAETENKIEKKKKEIKNANETITTNEQKVEDSKTLVAESHENIKIKQEELKDVIVALQYTESNNKELYTDYIFSASSISDMMERQAIAAQIVNYTQGELDSLEKLIKDNEALQVKLADDNVNLTNSIDEYERQVSELRDEMDKLYVVGLGVKEEIDAQKELIKAFEAAGCKNGDDVQECYYNKQGSSSSFSRPTATGRISQPWSATHGGIDIAVSKGTKVYATANGTVAYVQDGPTYLKNNGKKSCGGNIIYMHHTVGGKSYTTEYAHLTSYYVKPGQYVTKGTIIGTSGGDASTEWYDRCTFGAHLHYSIGTGFYPGKNYYKSTYNKNTYPTADFNVSALKSQRGWTWKTR